MVERQGYDTLIAQVNLHLAIGKRKSSKRRHRDDMLFDDAAIPGVMSLDGYVDLRHHDPVEVANFIKERVNLVQCNSTIAPILPTKIFELKDGDQTTYINVARFSLMVVQRGMVVNNMPPTNRKLLDTDNLGGTVHGLEQVMTAMRIEVAAGAASAVGAQRRTLTGSDRLCHKAA